MSLKKRLSPVDQRFITSSMGLGSTLDQSSKMRASNKWFRFLEKIVDGSPAEKPVEPTPEIRFTIINGLQVALCMHCADVGANICHACNRPYCLRHWPPFPVRRDKNRHDRQICMFCIAEETLGKKL